MTAHLTGALAAIIADPDCCAASKAIARDALSEEAQRISDAEAALDEIVQIAQAAGDYDLPRPLEPSRQGRTWYRGWEAAYDANAALWGCEGWYACLGGEDLDCIVVRGRTWAELLDEIDDHDKTDARGMIGGGL